MVHFNTLIIIIYDIGEAFSNAWLNCGKPQSMKWVEEEAEDRSATAAAAAKQEWSEGVSRFTCHLQSNILLAFYL